MDRNRKLTIGMIAHVDAGKTTLSEAILYSCGAIGRMGRVDHRDAFFDTDRQERERGITIFSKQAEFQLRGAGDIGEAIDVTLLDTPGHADFGAETERTLPVLDCAVLVIDGAESIGGHTLKLWALIKRYEIPAFIFVNKMDLCDPGSGGEREVRKGLMRAIRRELGGECVDMSGAEAGSERISDEYTCEEVAVCREELLDEFIKHGSIAKSSVAGAVAMRKIVPCFFGSALKSEGIKEFTDGLYSLSARCADAGAQGDGREEGPFAARVYKITRDGQGERLTHMKILSGRLKTRMALNTRPGGEESEEKVNRIRIYSGERFRTVREAEAGSICAVTGLGNSFAGQLISDGEEPPEGGAVKPGTEAALSYELILPEGVNVYEAYGRLRELEEEDPRLHLRWNERRQKIELSIMGRIQLEVIRNIIAGRYGIEAGFGRGQVSYRETLSKPVEGAGHFEPPGHYAEVHLLVEPLPRGSGIEYASACSEDEFAGNWQRLVMTHLAEREHPGTLTGSPITDVRISLLAGRAHPKHTEGGDFRQATYRALRQAFRKSLAAGTVELLEPWYGFRLDLPAAMAGKAASDILRMGGRTETPQICDTGEKSGDEGGTVTLTGKAPVSEMEDHFGDAAAYTKGFGSLLREVCGYESCHNRDEVVKAMGYEADRDVDNPSSSVFCVHGAGRVLPWDEADELMDISCARSPSAEGRKAGDEAEAGENPAASGGSEAELREIFDRAYGRNRNERKRKASDEARAFESEMERRRKKAEGGRKPEDAGEGREGLSGNEYLLVDGYNVIFAWDELRELARVNINSAREALIEILCNYRGYCKCELIAVFDAYRVRGGERRIEKHGNITIVYTAEAETADTYIERSTYFLSGGGAPREGGRGMRDMVRVVTSDRLEQLIIMGNNAVRTSAGEFRREVERVNESISEIIERNNRLNRTRCGSCIRMETIGEKEK